MVFSKLNVCATFLALGTLSAAFPANAAIVNGDFELPAPGVPLTQYKAGDNIAGWTVTGDPNNAVLLLSGAYLEPGIAFNPHSGNYALDLTGAGNTSPADGVWQNVATTAGQTYKLTFWVGNATGNGTGNSIYYTLPSSTGVVIGLASSVNYTNPNQSPGSINWQEYHYVFTATGPLTKIAFLNNTPSSPTTDNYLGLDDVSIAAVPEPATWAMIILGFAGVGGAACRRRRASVLPG